jgi:hypothetical protein
MGLAAYTHFTSPIRRFADQLVHALLTATLDRQHALAMSTSASASLLASASASASGSISGGSDCEEVEKGCVDSVENAVSAVIQQQDPWLAEFSPSTVAVINQRQRQHKKFQREMIIVEFVFAQCTLAGCDEVSLPARAVVLPFRYSEKHRRLKTDLYVITPTCQFLYPLRLHTVAQAQLFDVTYTGQHTMTIRDVQSGRERQLFVGKEIDVQVHCSKSASAMKKKCVLTSSHITF